MSALGLRHARVDDLDALLALYAQLNPDAPPPIRGRLARILEHGRSLEQDDRQVVALAAALTSGTFARRRTRDESWR